MTSLSWYVESCWVIGRVGHRDLGPPPLVGWYQRQRSPSAPCWRRDAYRTKQALSCSRSVGADGRRSSCWCWWYYHVVDRAHHRRLPAGCWHTPAYRHRTYDGWCYDDRRLMWNFPCMWWIPRVLDNCPVAHCSLHVEFLNSFRLPWTPATGPGGKTETIVVQRLRRRIFSSGLTAVT